MPSLGEILLFVFLSSVTFLVVGGPVFLCIRALRHAREERLRHQWPAPSAEVLRVPDWRFDALLAVGSVILLVLVLAAIARPQPALFVNTAAGYLVGLPMLLFVNLTMLAPAAGIGLAAYAVLRRGRLALVPPGPGEGHSRRFDMGLAFAVALGAAVVGALLFGIAPVVDFD
ncbi:MAG: hypothetical protein U1E56_02335 [Bauldia sp.]